MTDDRLKAIAKRLDAATPGPWDISDEQMPVEVWTDPQDTHIAVLDSRTDFAPGKTRCHANAKLIAHAPTDLRDLLAVVEVYRATLEHIKEIQEHIGGESVLLDDVNGALAEGARILSGEG